MMPPYMSMLVQISDATLGPMIASAPRDTSPIPTKPIRAPASGARNRKRLLSGWRKAYQMQPPIVAIDMTVAAGKSMGDNSTAISVNGAIEVPIPATREANARRRGHELVVDRTTSPV